MKVVRDSPVSLRLNGSSFHARGPAAAKDRSPKVLFWRGREQTRRSANRRDLRPESATSWESPAPSPTVHGRRDLPACTGYVAVQVASAAGAVLEWCVHIAECLWLDVWRHSEQTIDAKGDCRWRRSAEKHVLVHAQLRRGQCLRCCYYGSTASTFGPSHPVNHINLLTAKYAGHGICTIMLNTLCPKSDPLNSIPGLFPRDLVLVSW